MSTHLQMIGVQLVITLPLVLGITFSAKAQEPNVPQKSYANLLLEGGLKKDVQQISNDLIDRLAGFLDGAQQVGSSDLEKLFRPVNEDYGQLRKEMLADICKSSALKTNRSGPKFFGGRYGLEYVRERPCLLEQGIKVDQEIERLDDENLAKVLPGKPKSLQEFMKLFKSKPGQNDQAAKISAIAKTAAEESCIEKDGYFHSSKLYQDRKTCLEKQEKLNLSKLDALVNFQPPWSSGHPGLSDKKKETPNGGAKP